jgi:hypothetical protein
LGRPVAKRIASRLPSAEKRSRPPRRGEEEYFPPETIDFDATNVPAAVQSALEEAIKCHAQLCFVASAIMVRKTMEELCADRKAEGGNLKERIASLGTKVILPKELLEGLDGLWLLGNDAAHIESNVYKDAGREEVEIGIEVTKEVLKAVYQYAALVAKLNARKIKPPHLPKPKLPAGHMSKNNLKKREHFVSSLNRPDSFAAFPVPTR